MTASYGRMLVLLAVILAVEQVCAYSEEDWRAYSLSKVQTTDSVDLPVQFAGPMTMAGDALVLLSSDRDALVYVDTTTRRVVSTLQIESGWNLDVGAIASYRDDVYLLSRTTRQVIRFEKEKRLNQADVVFDLGACQLKGEVATDVFCIDSASVYVVCLAGFASRILRIDRRDRTIEFVADAAGTPSVLCVSNETLYYVRRSSAESDNCVVEAYSTLRTVGEWQAKLVSSLNLPFGIQSGTFRQKVVWCSTRGGDRLHRIVLKEAW
jgi:hypothetical protein